jgi:hydrogenase expression/formation protein HypC
MCLAVPALIKEIDGTEALVELGSVERKVSLTLTPEAGVGDYVLVHTGFAIGVVDEAEAHETLRLLQELFATYEGDDLFSGAVPSEAQPSDSGDYHPAPGLAVDLRKLADD